MRVLFDFKGLAMWKNSLISKKGLSDFQPYQGLRPPHACSFVILPEITGGTGTEAGFSTWRAAARRTGRRLGSAPRLDLAQLTATHTSLKFLPMGQAGSQHMTVEG
jgi:hypothetical protein